MEIKDALHIAHCAFVGSKEEDHKKQNEHHQTGGDIQDGNTLVQGKSF
jgi:hypothetical protein